MSSDFAFIDITRIQLREAKRIVNEDLDEHMNEYYNGIVIPEIQRRARASNLPDKFVDGFRFIKTGRGTGKIINIWGTTEKPLAKWFNYGTKSKIWIEPKDPDGVLAWPSGGPQGGRNASAIYYKNSNVKKGQALFSKGHYITGQPKTLSMEMGVEASKNPLMRQIVKDVNERIGRDEN